MIEERSYPTLDQFDRAYFIGIGGIGMSALARYFKRMGWSVAGYDKTPSFLTNKLEEEGIEIHYEDLNNSIPTHFQDKQKTLVIYTPAIPKNMGELLFFQHYEYQLFKRSEVLGIITRSSKGIGVAGTHGKTTTSSMLAHILNQSSVKADAFLGGIATNFNSNLVMNEGAEYTVIEADEFDRSFLRLKPFASIITSVDPDHLDIYGDSSHFQEGFELYAKLVNEEGLLVVRKGIDLQTSAGILTYGMNEVDADIIGLELRYVNGSTLVDVALEDQKWQAVELGIPGIHNADNALACIGICNFLGLSENEIRSGLKSFKGVKRRFEYQVKSQNLTYIDDYAHHPTEIKALVDSVRMLYPNQKITGIFQPHLFSRTRDFFEGFAAELSKLDEVILMPIYPAREEPIPGVTSDALLEKISCPSKSILDPKDVIEKMAALKEGVFLTIGAGDIDRIVEPLKQHWS